MVGQVPLWNLLGVSQQEDQRKGEGEANRSECRNHNYAGFVELFLDIHEFCGCIHRSMYLLKTNITVLASNSVTKIRTAPVSFAWHSLIMPPPCLWFPLLGHDIQDAPDHGSDKAKGQGQAPQPSREQPGQVPQKGQVPLEGHAPLEGQVSLEGQAPLEGQLPLEGHAPLEVQEPTQRPVPPKAKGTGNRESEACPCVGIPPKAKRRRRKAMCLEFTLPGKSTRSRRLARHTIIPVNVF